MIKKINSWVMPALLLSYVKNSQSCTVQICGAIDTRGKYATAHGHIKEGMDFYKAYVDNTKLFDLNIGNTLTTCKFEIKTFEGMTADAAGNLTLQSENWLNAYLATVQDTTEYQCNVYFFPDLIPASIQSEISHVLAGYNLPTLTSWINALDSTKTLSAGSIAGYLSSLSSFQNAFFLDGKLMKTELLFSESREPNAEAGFFLAPEQSKLDYGLEESNMTWMEYITHPSRYINRNADGSPNVDHLLQASKSYPADLDALVVIYPTEKEVAAIGDMIKDAKFPVKTVCMVAPYFLGEEEPQFFDHFLQTSRWPLSSSYGGGPDGSDPRFLGSTDFFIKKWEEEKKNEPDMFHVEGAEMLAMLQKILEKNDCEPTQNLIVGEDFKDRTAKRTAFTNCLTNITVLKSTNYGSIFSTELFFVQSPSKYTLNYNFTPPLLQYVNNTVIKQDVKDITFPSPFPTISVQKVEHAMSVGIYVVSALLVAIISGLIVFIIIFRNSRVFKASAYVYLIVILVGCLISACSIFLAGAEQSTGMCTATYVVRDIGYFITWSFLIVKTYRLSRALQFSQNITPDRTLAIYLGVAFLIFSLVLALVTGFKPSQAQENQIDILTIYYSCSFPVFSYIFVCLQVLFTVLAFFMSYQVRHAPTAFNESRYIVAVSAFTFFTAVIFYLVTLVFQIENRTADFDFVVYSCYILVEVTFFVSVFYGPKLYEHFRREIGLKSNSKSQSRGVSEPTTYSFENGPGEVQRWKPWVAGKWDPTVTANEQKLKIDAMVSKFNQLLTHAHELTHTMRGQRILLQNSGISEEEQRRFLETYGNGNGNYSVQKGSNFGSGIGSSSQILGFAFGKKKNKSKYQDNELGSDNYESRCTSSAEIVMLESCSDGE